MYLVRFERAAMGAYAATFFGGCALAIAYLLTLRVYEYLNMHRVYICQTEFSL